LDYRRENCVGCPPSPERALLRSPCPEREPFAGLDFYDIGERESLESGRSAVAAVSLPDGIFKAYFGPGFYDADLHLGTPAAFCPNAAAVLAKLIKPADDTAGLAVTHVVVRIDAF
jgi:hypothetical protein